MKKVFAFILTFFLFANFLPAYAANDNDEKSMEDFYSQMDEIILNCDNAGASSDNIENLPTNRLIVKTKTNESLKNYYDAIYVAEGYDGLHILQYENEVDTAYAYNKLKSDNIEYVEYDYYLSVTETDAEKVTWRSNNSDIVSVDCNGNITGVSKGDTKITCTLPTGEKIIWKVNVKYSPLQAFFVMFFFGFLWI